MPTHLFVVLQTWQNDVREEKGEAKARKNATVINVKEVKLTPKQEFTILIKLKHARIIEKGDKVKVTIRFRGREMAHREYGESMCYNCMKE